MLSADRRENSFQLTPVPLIYKPVCNIFCAELGARRVRIKKGLTGSLSLKLSCEDIYIM